MWKYDLLFLFRHTKFVIHSKENKISFLCFWKFLIVYGEKLCNFIKPKEITWFVVTLTLIAY